MKLTATTFKRGITPKGATKKAPLLSFVRRKTKPKEGEKWQSKIISKIQLIENKQVTLLI